MKTLPFLVVMMSAVLGLSASADVDPYNTYLWNRANVEAHNGQVDRGDWFEWWYFKVVDPTDGQAFYFIYGVTNPWDLKGTARVSKAMLQVGDFQGNILLTKDFPLDQFSAAYDKTEVRIGANQATDQHLSGHLTDLTNDVSWDLSMTKSWTFAAMGWAMKVPDLCGIYWYPAQASATMTGWVKVNGKTVSFNGASAYQDRNWGRSFPKWWTWLVSNDFKNSPGTALAAGGGEPKVFSAVYAFPGLSIGLKYNGQEYVFRAMDLDQIDFDIHWGAWNVVAENGRAQRIEISAYAPPEKFIDIPFESPQADSFHDYEALLGTMTVKLYSWNYLRAQWSTIAVLESENAGIEWGSPTPVALGLHSFSTLYNTAKPLR